MTDSGSADRQSDAIRIVLVHGTLLRLFGRRPENAEDVRNFFPWTDPNKESSLAAALAALAPAGKRISLSLLPWSGRNSSQAREKAADDLRVLLNDDTETRTVVVAHSHGGNVALRAIQKLGGSPKNVLGIVSMATPFLQRLPRDVNGILGIHQIWMAFILLVEIFIGLMAFGLALIGGIGIFQKFLGGPLDELTWLAILGLFIGGVAALILIPVVHRLLKLPTDAEFRLHTRARQRLSLRGHLKPIETPFLCISAAGDEAGAWLEFCSSASAIPYVFRNRFVAVTALAILAATAFIFWGWPYVAAETDDGAGRVFVAILLSIAASCLIYLAAAGAAISIAMAIQWLPVTFGQSAASGGVTRTMVSLTPPFARRVDFQAFLGHTLLLHSIYSNRKVQHRIANWIGQRIADAE